MHFVIFAFIALICLITAVLFTEVFPRWFKVIIALIGSASSGYALAILSRKIVIWTKLSIKIELLPATIICALGVLAIITIVTIILHKKNKA